MQRALHTPQYGNELEELRAKLKAKSEECEEVEGRLAFVLGNDLEAKKREVEERARQLARSRAETEMLMDRKARVQAGYTPVGTPVSTPNGGSSGNVTSSKELPADGAEGESTSALEKAFANLFKPDWGIAWASPRTTPRKTDEVATPVKTVV